LRARIEPHITGPGWCLYHRLDRASGQHDLEVCFPVVESAEITGPGDPAITQWILPGVDVLCLAGPAAEMRQRWGEMWTYSVEQRITWADTVLYRELHPDAGTLEIQAPLHMPVWLERLAEGLDQQVGPDARRAIMAGSAGLYADTPAIERATWATATIARLNEAVPDESARKQIVSRCAHIFPPERIEKARGWYEELGGTLDDLGNLDALLERMKSDGYYGVLERDGRVIYSSKRPFRPDEHAAATDPAEKRAAYCYCGMVQAAILSGQDLSATFCYCGTGWPTQLWEGILGQPLRVELDESILRGDDRCRFAIHLPEQV
ncbi:MAG: hypothetical protein JXQ72_02860, partial [Anaerolineae bacterium]|nr:hypothetical protein [Anaerolineae bacterium]